MFSISRNLLSRLSQINGNIGNYQSFNKKLSNLLGGKEEAPSVFVPAMMEALKLLTPLEVTEVVNLVTTYARSLTSTKNVYGASTNTDYTYLVDEFRKEYTRALQGQRLVYVKEIQVRPQTDEIEAERVLDRLIKGDKANIVTTIEETHADAEISPVVASKMPSFGDDDGIEEEIDIDEDDGLYDVTFGNPVQNTSAAETYSFPILKAMNREELRALAKKYRMNLSGAQRIDEIRSAIMDCFEVEPHLQSMWVHTQEEAEYNRQLEQFEEEKARRGGF